MTKAAFFRNNRQPQQQPAAATSPSTSDHGLASRLNNAVRFGGAHSSDEDEPSHAASSSAQRYGNGSRSNRFPDTSEDEMSPGNGDHGYAQLGDDDDDGADRDDQLGAPEPDPRALRRSDTYTRLPERKRTLRQRTAELDDHGPSAIHAPSPPPFSRALDSTDTSFTSPLSPSFSAERLPHVGGSGSGGGGGGALSSSTSTAATALTNISAATELTSPTYGSDEMLMALLASQATVDCESMSIGAWEEVEGWKKELSLLATRLDALQTRHQREVKILTAARTLQKLNQTNKRISRQTMESLEQSEKRVEAAEKEVLVLRDREAALRRRLNEHWAGVMAWEVRRLERAAAESSSRQQALVQAAESAHEREMGYAKRVTALETDRDAHDDHVSELKAQRDQHFARVRDLESGRSRELETSRSRQQETDTQVEALEQERDRAIGRVRDLETEGARQNGRIAELEEMIVEFGRRERALEEESKAHQDELAKVQSDRQSWQRERAAFVSAKEQWAVERSGIGHAQDSITSERSAWVKERTQLTEQHRALEGQFGALQTVHDELAAQHEQLSGQHGQLRTAHDALQVDLADIRAAHDDTRTRHCELEETHQGLNDKYVLITSQSSQAQLDLGDLQAQHRQLQAEHQELVDRHEAVESQTGLLQAQLGEAETQHRATQDELATLRAQQDQLHKHEGNMQSERTRLLEAAGLAKTASRQAAERLAAIGTAIGALLGRDTVPDKELDDAIADVGTLVQSRETELQSLKEEMLEVSQGLEDEMRRLRADRDGWKTKASEAQAMADEEHARAEAAQAAADEHAESARSVTQSQRGVQGEMMELMRKIRGQNEQIEHLNKQNDGLAADLETAHREITGRKKAGDADPVATNAKIAELETKLSAINSQLSSVWTILPSSESREQAGFSSPSVVSPNATVNFAALQRAYAEPATREEFPGVNALADRVRTLIADGRLMIERMTRMEVDKERHKANAAKAAQLVQDSSRSMETYQRQVMELEERLNKKTRLSSRLSKASTTAGDRASTSKQDELDELRATAEISTAAKQRLETELANANATISRLNDINSNLSARTLTLSDEAETERRTLQTQLQNQIDDLSRKLRTTTEDADHERARGQEQQMQMLDELNSLQAEVGQLRQKLRAKGG
ncbi:uncharacterized protein LOC62_05G007457 [Vanrija pseudolonga]|uniref:Up-regulated during septation protein 1 domain-containing protein n=1 Tax=Vanrija pseudolonga TaxID=143232 RepID=A0AAF1BN12_9TREE|nr:hypothetical protein LOC62_05G007457 [Vanrija pseudolonga]